MKIVKKKIILGTGRDEDREARYAYSSSFIPPVENSRNLNDRERDAVKMSSLEVKLEQAVGNEILTEQLLNQMRKLNGMLRRPQFFYDDEGNYLSDSEDELDIFNYQRPSTSERLEIMRTGKGLSFKKRTVILGTGGRQSSLVGDEDTLELERQQSSIINSRDYLERTIQHYEEQLNYLSSLPTNDDRRDDIPAMRSLTNALIRRLNNILVPADAYMTRSAEPTIPTPARRNILERFRITPQPAIPIASAINLNNLEAAPIDATATPARNRNSPRRNRIAPEPTIGNGISFKKRMVRPCS